MTESFNDALDRHVDRQVRFFNSFFKKVGRRRAKFLAIMMLVLVVLGFGGFAYFLWQWSPGSKIATMILLPITVCGYVQQLRRIIRRRASRTTHRYMKSPSDVVLAPLPAKYLLYLFLPEKAREPVLGDLEEEYQKIYKKFGERPANFWFYKQILTSLWPMLQTTSRTLVKWGLIGWLEEVIRRIAH